MKSFNLVSLFTLFMLFACAEQSENDAARYSVYFEKLNEALEHSEEYTDVFNAQLLSYKQKAAQAVDIEGRYFYNKLIYERYILYRSDSAYHYLNKNIAIARSAEKSQWKAETLIAKAYLYTASGMLGDVPPVFLEVETLPMSKELRREYYVQQLFYYTHVENYMQNDMRREIIQYADSLIRLEPQPTSSFNLWGRFWLVQKGKKDARLMEQIEAQLNRMKSEDPWYSRLCFAVGRLSSDANDTENEIKYCVEMCITDIRDVSRDLPMLPLLANLASQVGELNYANRFMRAAVAIQNDFPDRARSVYLNQHILSVYNANIKKLEMQEVAQRNINRLLIPVAMLLLILLLYTIWSLARRRKMHVRLEENNRELNRRADEVLQMERQMAVKNEELEKQSALLAKTNQHLLEANYLKEKYIGNLFTVCSEYINKTETFHKTVNRKLKAHQYEALLQLTESSEQQISGDVQELYGTFDRIFLSIFPHFVEEFNSLLRPEEQIKVHGQDSLTAEIRIYALVRLGINNSVKIAGILHVSPQTIYNSRMKVRGKALPSDEDFPQRVMRLGGSMQADDTLITDE